MRKVGSIGNSRVCVLLIIGSVTLAGLLSACSSSDPSSTSNTNQVIFEVAEVPSGGPIILSDQYQDLDRSVEMDLMLFAKDLGLSELPRNPDPERFEFRLWTNLGVAAMGGFWPFGPMLLSSGQILSRLGFGQAEPRSTKRRSTKRNLESPDQAGTESLTRLRAD
jgi:hypothetical protein